MSRYPIIIENDGGSWGAYAPDLPGLGVAGGSRQEVETLVREAIELHLSTLREIGEPIPDPSEVLFVEVA